MTNKDRGRRGEEALNTCMSSRDNALSTLLADLMHWADYEGGGFVQALIDARRSYQDHVREHVKIKEAA
jgi:hypothetical protein